MKKPKTFNFNYPYFSHKLCQIAVSPSNYLADKVMAEWGDVIHNERGRLIQAGMELPPRPLSKQLGQTAFSEIGGNMYTYFYDWFVIVERYDGSNSFFHKIDHRTFQVYYHITDNHWIEITNNSDVYDMKQLWADEQMKRAFLRTIDNVKLDWCYGK